MTGQIVGALARQGSTSRRAWWVGAMVVAAFGQGCSCSKTPTNFQASVAISQPTNNQTIHTSDDEDTATSGIQFSVKATVNGVVDGSTATLFIDGAAVDGQSKTVAIVDNAGAVTFEKPTLPPGAHTLSVKVQDKTTASKTATDTRTVTVDGTNSALCTFVTPTNGQALKLVDDASPAVAGEQYDVQVSCPTLAAGSAVTLTLESPSALGGIQRKVGSQVTSGALIDFGVINLSEGANILHFVAAPSSGAVIIVDNQITVDTGKCGVWISDADDVIYNAKGEHAAAETRTVIADTKPATAGEQGTFTAYVDTAKCPAGSQATLKFNGTSAGTAAVGADGKVVFTDVTIPEGDPVTESVSVVGSSGGLSGDSFTNHFHVDSLVPVLTFITPGTTLTSVQDVDTTKPGIQARVKLSTTNVTSTTTVTIADSAVPNALFGPSPAGALEVNDTFTLSADTTFTVRTHTLTANATRPLGNKSATATVNTVVTSAGVSVVLVSPTFTAINIANDADPTSTNTCEVDTVVTVSPANATVQYSVNHGTPTSATANNGQANKRLSLPQGASSMRIVASDASGADSQIDLNFTCDTIAPTISFTAPAPNTTVHSQTPSVSVHTSEPAGSTVKILNASGGVVGSANTDASGNASIVVNLPTGTQTLTATVTDAAGNPSAPATLTINVDTGSACDLQFTAPNLAQQVFNLNNTAAATPSRTYTISGVSTRCKNTQVTLTKALAGTSAEVAVGTATTDAVTGIFSFTLAVPDNESDTRLFARLGTGSSAGQGSFEYTTDFTPPVISNLSPAAGLLRIVAANDPRLPQPNFIGDMDPALADGQLDVQVAYAGAGTNSPLITSPGTIAFKSATTTFATFDAVDDASNTLAQRVTFPDGTNGNVDIVVTDGAGNTATLSWTLGVALTPLPTSFTLTDPSTTVNALNELGSNRQDRADVRGFAITGTSVPPGSTAVMCSNVAVPNTAIPCPDGSGFFELPGSTINASGTQLLFPDAVVPQGPVTLVAVLIDPVGSSLTSSSQTLTVDTVPPQVVSVAVTEDTNSDHLLNASESSGTFHVVVTYSGVEDGQSSTLTIPGLGVVGTQTVHNNSATFTVSISRDGNYTLQVSVSDAAGNPNISTAVTPHIDNAAATVALALALQPPQISITSPTSTTCNHADDSNHGTSACDITVTASVSAGVTTVTFTGDGAPGSNTVAPTSGTASASYAIPEGSSRTITVTAVDQAGNTTSASLTLNVDTTAPTLAFTSPANGDTTTEQNFQATFTSDAEDGQVVSVYSEPSHTLVGSDPVSGGSVTVAISAPLGTQSLQATVTDAAGNVSAVASIVITVTQTGCDLTFSSPSASSTVLTAATTASLTVSGRSTVCPNTQLILSKSENGGTETSITTVTTDNLGNFSVPVTFTDGVVTVLHARITQSGVTNDFTRTVKTDVTAPTLSIAAPTLTSSGQLFIVAAAGNLHVKAGEAGYTADTSSQNGGQFNLDLTVAGAGDVFGGSGTGSVKVVTGTGTTLLSQTISTDGSTHYSGATALPTVTVPQGFVGTLKVIATDSVGNSTTTTWSNVTVDVVAPNTPSLVISDPGTGVYTHVLDPRTASVRAVWTTPTDDGPAGQTLTWDFGYTTSTLLGSATFDDAAFDNAALTSKVSPGNVGATGSVVSVTLDKVPTFNTYYLAPRLVDAVGNRSAIAAGTVAVSLQKETLQPSGLTGTGAFYGSQVAVGDVDGDGINDLVVAAPFANNGVGQVTIYYGDSAASFSRTFTLSGNTSTDSFGYPLAVGDVNGDGIADLVIGTANFTQMNIYLGAATQGISTRTCSVPGFTNIGGLFVIGDLDGDGKNDIVVADYGPVSKGEILVFPGRSNWASFSGDVSNAKTRVTNNAAPNNGVLGAGLQVVTEINDVNGDSVPDLVVTVPTHNSAYVLSGALLNSTASGDVSTYALSTLYQLPSSASHLFGSAVLPIDLSYTGRQNLIFGDGDGTNSNLVAIDQDSSHQLVNERIFEYGTDGFGYALAVGDINGDGHDDLAAGGFGTVTGTASLYLSGATSVPTHHNGEISGATSFGFAMTVGDVTGDGKPDLVVSEPNSQNGSVYVYH